MPGRTVAPVVRSGPTAACRNGLEHIPATRRRSIVLPYAPERRRKAVRPACGPSTFPPAGVTFCGKPGNPPGTKAGFRGELGNRTGAESGVRRPGHIRRLIANCLPVGNKYAISFWVSDCGAVTATSASAARHGIQPINRTSKASHGARGRHGRPTTMDAGRGGSRALWRRAWPARLLRRQLRRRTPSGAPPRSRARSGSAREACSPRSALPRSGTCRRAVMASSCGGDSGTPWSAPPLFGQTLYTCFSALDSNG